MCQPTTLGSEEADTCQSFSGLTNYSKNFYLSWCHSNFQQISKQNPIHFQPVSKLFQTKQKSSVEKPKLCKMTPTKSLNL